MSVPLYTSLGLRPAGDLLRLDLDSPAAPAMQFMANSPRTA